MTAQIVRTEKRHYDGDRYPSQVAYTEAGTWVVPADHLGRWPGQLTATADGAPARGSGGKLTHDDLHVSVVAIALQKGWPPSDETAALTELYQERDGDLPGSASTAAADLAARALAWLNETTPAGRRFVLEDALYLVEDPGPDA